MADPLFVQKSIHIQKIITALSLAFFIFFPVAQPARESGGNNPVQSCLKNDMVVLRFIDGFCGVAVSRRTGSVARAETGQLPGRPTSKLLLTFREVATGFCCAPASVLRPLPYIE